MRHDLIIDTQLERCNSKSLSRVRRLVLKIHSRDRRNCAFSTRLDINYVYYEKKIDGIELLSKSTTWFVVNIRLKKIISIIFFKSSIKCFALKVRDQSVEFSTKLLSPSLSRHFGYESIFKVDLVNLENQVCSKVKYRSRID